MPEYDGGLTMSNNSPVFTAVTSVLISWAPGQVGELFLGSPFQKPLDLYAVRSVESQVTPKQQMSCHASTTTRFGPKAACHSCEFCCWEYSVGPRRMDNGEGWRVVGGSSTSIAALVSHSCRRRPCNGLLDASREACVGFTPGNHWCFLIFCFVAVSSHQLL